MRLVLLVSTLLLPFLFITPVFAQAQPKQEFMKARVVKILKEGEKTVGSTTNSFQLIELNILDGSDKGKTITAEHGGLFTIADAQKVSPDETVVLSKILVNGKTQYHITDSYRLNTLLGILIAFGILIIAMAGKRGAGSILGMFVSLAVIFFFIVPQIMQGSNPLLISIIGALFIMVTTIYLAHGISQQTTISIISTFLSLIITISISILFVMLMKLSGLGSEDIYSLVQGFQGTINFQGLLLGGMIIGTLGVLDDVTTTQTATMYALAEANTSYSVKTLFNHGMKIGREHITSLVNTLVLAYAGASIGVFIYLVLGTQRGTEPLWVMLNSEFIIEEIVRTLAGSIGLVLAVPITTLLASFFAKYSVKIK